MRAFTIIQAVALASTAFACFTKRDSGPDDWSYDSPTHWPDNPTYGQCQNGTQQSPLNLLKSDLSSSAHRPTFNYNGNWTGTLSNNGHSLLFTFAEQKDLKKFPSFTFDRETVYLQSFHFHTPAEHTYEGDRSTAELHMVHVDGAGKPRAVVGFRIDPSHKRRDLSSTFFSQFGKLPGHDDGDGKITIQNLNPQLALKEVQDFKKYWTYSGSLTTPPCAEGLRWFVANEGLELGDAQLQELLAVSRYSSRPTQRVWLHGVGK